MKRPILLIGGGRMGGALLKGWIRNGVAPIALVEPKVTPALRRLTAAGGITMYKNIDQVAGGARACVIALKPQVLKSEAARLAPLSRSGALMISIAAGTPAKSLMAAWGKDARIVRAMPNTPGAIGRGITALYAVRGTTGADRKLAQSLLSALGETLWVEREGLIDSVTAVSGSGPAYVFLLMEALAAAAEAEGFAPLAAARLARATVAGAGALLDTDGRSAADLRRDVTSPGGTTEAALRVLMAKNGLAPLIARAVHAARRRAEELGG